MRPDPSLVPGASFSGWQEHLRGAGQVDLNSHEPARTQNTRDLHSPLATALVAISA
jgi:hypothetical protein